MAHLLSSFRQCVSLPRLSRSVVNRAALRPTPQPTGIISGPADLLKAIGREAETKVTAETWEELWKLDGHAMKKAEVPVKDRRYIMWCLEKFRQGYAPEEFAHPPQPRKKIRGWGPTNQKKKASKRQRA